MDSFNILTQVQPKREDPHLALRISELKKIVNDLEKQNIEIKDFENYEFPLILESAEKKIEFIMKKESVNELTIARKYLPEIFSADILDISKDDGLPILKPFAIQYFSSKGIITEFYGNVIKFKKHGKNKSE